VVRGPSWVLIARFLKNRGQGERFLWEKLLGKAGESCVGALLNGQKEGYKGGALKTTY